MKKLILILLLTIGITPAFAQGTGGKAVVRAGKATATQSSIALKVGEQMTRRSLSRAGMIQITNWVTKPTVQMHPNGQSQLASVGELPVLESRVLDWKTVDLYLFPRGHDGRVMYIPTSWKNWKDPSDAARYRGMIFTRLEQVKHLLESGMELSKISPHYPGIFSSSELDTALKYASPLGAVYPVLPVMVKMPAVYELSKENEPDGLVDFMRVIRRDIAPEFISDVMVFLEVNGEPGWYKAVLHEGEMVFIPAYGTLFSW
ncbi:MAG: hypothetical protein MJ053_07215 [Elusimicrobiaceae bacterium]|nr:hypothetical protein [Elusimicrobiaceae bacterium]